MKRNNWCQLVFTSNFMILKTNALLKDLKINFKTFMEKLKYWKEKEKLCLGFKG